MHESFYSCMYCPMYLLMYRCTYALYVCMMYDNVCIYVYINLFLNKYMYVCMVCMSTKMYIHVNQQIFRLGCGNPCFCRNGPSSGLK